MSASVSVSEAEREAEGEVKVRLRCTLAGDPLPRRATYRSCAQCAGWKVAHAEWPSPVVGAAKLQGWLGLGGMATAFWVGFLAGDQRGDQVWVLVRFQIMFWVRAEESCRDLTQACYKTYRQRPGMT